MNATSNQGKTKPSPIPEGVTFATPYLTVRDGIEALAFYQRAFGANERMRIVQPDGNLGHAEITLGKAPIMISGEFPSMGVVGPQTLGGTSVSLHVYVEDVDAFAKRALDAGCKLLKPITDEFYGERVARLEDPFGHRWSFASRIEEVSPEEMMRRAEAYKGEE
jgi:PhnB protein